MLERANTATREVLARSVRGVGRLGANSLKERYQSPELSRDHTPTRSLGGAETGRSAMNGNDEPRACAACKLVFEHQNAAAHSCKQCKLPVHSWVVCDMVWMPEEGEYFWQALPRGVQRQRVDSPVEPPGQGGA